MLSRTAMLAAIALTLGTGAAAAFDISEMAVGQTVRWRVENGNTSVTFLGLGGRRGYKLAFHRDASKGQPFDMTWWSARDGQLLRAVAPGIDDRYSPNDCSLTLGRCVYTITRLDGRREQRIHLASQKDGTWSYREYSGQEDAAYLVERGTFTVDDFGFVINHDYTLGDGAPRWSRRKNR